MHPAGHVWKLLEGTAAPLTVAEARILSDAPLLYTRENCHSRSINVAEVRKEGPFDRKGTISMELGSLARLWQSCEDTCL